MDDLKKLNKAEFLMIWPKQHKISTDDIWESLEFVRYRSMSESLMVEE